MKKYTTLFIILALVLSVLLPGVSLAQPVTPPINPSSDGTDPFGFGDQLDNIAAPYDPQNDVPLEQRIGDIIGIVLSLLGVVFLILMIYAGFNWMTAGGDEEQITKSRNTIRAAIIGLVIVIASYALSVFIIENLWGTGL